MSGQKGRGWTLLVIAEDGSHIRQFRIPRKAIMTLLAVALLVIVYAAVETVLFWIVARRAAQVEPLKRRVAELQSSSSELARIGSDLAKLKVFEQQLRKVLSNRESGGLEPLPWEGEPAKILPGAAEETPGAAKATTHPIGVARSLGGVAYTAMDLPTLPPVRGFATRRFTPPVFSQGAGHPGLDIAAREGTPVLASADGLVVFSDWTWLYGNLVVLTHRSGFVSLYGHCQVLLVRPGERVRQGQPIALLGNSGISTAPHLHFELWQDGSPVDPAALLKTFP